MTAPAETTVSSPSPERLIFAQHGWADSGKHLGSLVRSIAPPRSEVIAPSLTYLHTWLRINWLVQQKEAIAQAALTNHPDLPVRIVAHSMGGLIWTELLHRHPDWWERIESFVMVGSPIAGSDMARLIDPWGWGIGIARDLGRDRRNLAEQIAQQLPTLVIVSDLGQGSDGLVPIEASKVPGSELRVLRDIPHSAMRYSPTVAQEIADFWQANDCKLEVLPPTVESAIRLLRSIPGMTGTGHRDFARARPRCNLGNGLTLKTWKNPAQVLHVYLAEQDVERGDRCLFAGYVGWGHRSELERAIADLSTKSVS